jgi:hypothetical protein
VQACHLEIFVEEESAEAALSVLVPRIIGDAITFKIHAYQGKADLLKKLPERLQGYRNWIPEDWRIVVLADRDSESCVDLKASLEQHSAAVPLPTRTRPGHDGRVVVLNRLAIEELEAWFFGDTEAVLAAYPGVPASLHARAPYRDPDAIRGGTWEKLEQVLQRAGHHKGGLAKVRAAREISMHMEPQRNRSQSFKTFRHGLSELIGPCDLTQERWTHRNLSVGWPRTVRG